jgi:putative ABC transport system permease protein
MKNILGKDILREIWKTKGRFISILAIVAVGVGFFAGVKASSPDMKLTMERYVDSSQLMDLQLLSTYGFNNDDLAAIRADDDVRGVQAGYATDVYVDFQGQSGTTAHVMSLPQDLSADDPDNIDQLTLVEGRMPQNNQECVMEKVPFGKSTFGIGDTVRLAAPEGEDLSSTLKRDEYTIVGYVQSPLYIAFDRGKTKLGNGTIGVYMLIPREDFALDVYTNVYLTLNSTQGLFSFDTPYTDAVELGKNRFQAVADIREPARLQETRDKAQAEIDKAKAQVADGEATQQSKLAEAQKEIDDGQQELDDGRQQLAAGRAAFEAQTADARRQISEAEDTLNAKEDQYTQGLADYEKNAAAYPQQKQEALNQLTALADQKAQLSAQLDALQQKLDGITAARQAFGSVLTGYRSAFVPDASAIPAETQQAIAAAGALSELAGGADISGMLTQYVLTDPVDPSKETQYAALDSLLTQIDGAVQQIESQLQDGQNAVAQMQAAIDQGYADLAAGEEALTQAKAQLDAARGQLDDGWTQLHSKEAALNDGIAEANQKFAQTEETLAQGEQKLADARTLYQESKTKSDQEIADAKKKISDSEAKVADLQMPQWYIQNRDDNPGYANFSGDADKVDAISAVFPVFFILVAALVCLTTMTRMVEEQRIQIGTLKALGYGRRAIASKFLIYAIAASLVGSVVGLIIGFQLFPGVVLNAYGIRYYIPQTYTPFHWDYAFWCTLVAVVIIGLAAWAAVRQELMEPAAQLMRPKAPPAGRRVLLERVTPVWRRLSFTQKVTVRNLLRYKKRFFMTVLGVAGCTALMLTGFGINYAITEIVPKQYPAIFAYNALAVLEEDLSAQQAEDVLKNTQQNQGVSGAMLVMQESMEKELDSGKKVEVYVFVPQQPQQIDDYIKLHERVSRKPLTLDDQGAIITEKLARLWNLKVGDTLTVQDSQGKDFSVPIAGITENYALHYIYLTPSYYQTLTGETPVYNMMMFNVAEGADENAVSETILKDDGVRGIQLMSEAHKNFRDSVKSLISVVFAIIASAGMLAIIVLYNLTNINITERIREIASIKVLGFHDKEVSAYIYRENIISTLIGIAVGLFGGIYLEGFVISKAEIESVMFAQGLPPYTFVLSGLITLCFALLVNLVMHFKLKHVPMVESLKSAE